jgi:hypothetical protein
MITKRKRLSAVLILALGLTIGIQAIAPAAPMGTAFTFQGRFTDSNSPANGIYDFEWKLYDDPNAGTQLGSTVYSDNLDVNDGDFTAVLDFGSGIFDGNEQGLGSALRLVIYFLTFFSSIVYSLPLWADLYDSNRRINMRSATRSVLTVKNRPGDPNITFLYDITGRIYDVNDAGDITEYYYDRIGRISDVNDP